MVIRSPWDNRISRRDDSLLAQLAGMEIDALSRHAHARMGSAPRPAVRPAAPEPAAPNEPPDSPSPSDDMPDDATGEPETAQEVSFAEVLQELQSRITHRDGDALPHWPRSNIQNAPPAVAKLLGMKT